jgi:hypothetical protein
MGQVLHGSATTTEAVRRAIQRHRQLRVTDAPVMAEVGCSRGAVTQQRQCR